MTIPVQGAKWTDIIGAGIVCRNIWYSSTSDFYDSVASSNMKKSHSYTDNHDVDEDNVTISVYGGLWNIGNSAGVTYRYVFDSPSWIQPGNASGRRHLEMFIYYTDEHDVDENMVTIMNQSGMWLNGSMVGITIRTMNDTSTSSPDYVASSDIKN